MSSASDIAIILSNLSHGHALDVVEQSLARLIDQYEFGFRSYGGALQLVFEGSEFIQEKFINDKIPSVAAIDRPMIEQLVGRYEWLSIGGSIRVPELEHLVDLDLILFPTFDAVSPACVLFRLEGDLYRIIRGEDDNFNEDTAKLLLKFSISLGANDLVDGFQAILIADLDDVQTFDGEALRQVLLKPQSVENRISGVGLRTGFVVGIRSQEISSDEIRKIWRNSRVFETVNRFTVLNRLVDFKNPRRG